MLGMTEVLKHMEIWNIRKKMVGNSERNSMAKEQGAREQGTFFNGRCSGRYWVWSVFLPTISNNINVWSHPERQTTPSTTAMTSSPLKAAHWSHPFSCLSGKIATSFCDQRSVRRISSWAKAWSRPWAFILLVSSAWISSTSSLPISHGFSTIPTSCRSSSTSCWMLPCRLQRL